MNLFKVLCYLVVIILLILISFNIISSPSLKHPMSTSQLLLSVTLTHQSVTSTFQSHATTRVSTLLVWCSGCWLARCCACVEALATNYPGKSCLICTSTEILKRFVLHYNHFHWSVTFELLSLQTTVAFRQLSKYTSYFKPKIISCILMIISSR